MRSITFWMASTQYLSSGERSIKLYPCMLWATAAAVNNIPFVRAQNAKLELPDQTAVHNSNTCVCSNFYSVVKTCIPYLCGSPKSEAYTGVGLARRRTGTPLQL